MSYYLFWPDPDALSAAGYGAIAHVPCIFQSNWIYEDMASRYLRERALLEWVPGTDTLMAWMRGRRPTRASLETYGFALCNFLEWCEFRGLDWHQVQYLHNIVNGYQEEMLVGAWSASKQPLKSSTVNLRVKEACHFLSWAAHRLLRSAFHIESTLRHVVAPSYHSTHGHRPLEVQSRLGSVRPDPKTLRIPTDQEIASWHTAVRIERGYTKALMCELILKTGIRREEAVQWRVDTLPLSRDGWLARGDCVEVSISYGAKGPKRIDAKGVEQGPSRVIALPLSLAMQLDHYREFIRPGQRAAFVRAAPSVEERRRRIRLVPQQLFLSDFTGEPVSAQSLYEAWTMVSRLPFKGWAPHQGRHYWACKTMLRAIRERICMLDLAGQSAVTGDWTSGCGMDTIQLVIRPQLGHVSAETSQVYLVWLQRTFTLTTLHDEYEKSLEEVISTVRESG